MKNQDYFCQDWD